MLPGLAGLVRSPIFTLLAAGLSLLPQAFSLNFWEAPARPGGIHGTVLDDYGKPMANAVVAVSGRPSQGITDGRGRFQLGSIPPGSHVLVIDRPGYLPQAIPITVSPGKDLKLEVTLRHETGYAMA
jgi:hypothetical protein